LISPIQKAKKRRHDLLPMAHSGSYAVGSRAAEEA
jgi:hypothetical protein